MCLAPYARPVLVYLALLLAIPTLADDCLNMHVISNAPMGYIDANGRATGVHWDYLTAIEKESGVCINKRLMPYARLWRSLADGQHDGGIIFRSPGREQTSKLVAQIRNLRTVVIPQKGIPLESYADLSGLIIGKTRGTRLSDRFDNDATLLKLELNDYAQAAKMIQRGRLDAIAGSGVLLNYHLSKQQLLNQVDLSQGFTLGRREQWLQLSRKSKHLSKTLRLKQATEQLRAEGVLDRIMTKYHGGRWRLANKEPLSSYSTFK